MKPRGGEAVSTRTAQKAVGRTIEASIFHYQDFKTTAHDRKRLDSLIQTMVLDGRLTNDLKRERRWVGTRMVARMVQALYQDALFNGTKSWDITLVQVQSLLLHTALACRVGDISSSPLDRHALPFLTYGDITMKLSGGRKVDHLTMSIRIRNAKGCK